MSYKVATICLWSVWLAAMVANFGLYFYVGRYGWTMPFRRGRRGGE